MIKYKNLAMILIIGVISMGLSSCGGKAKLITTQTNGDVSVAIYASNPKPIFKKGKNKVKMKFTKGGKPFDAGKSVKLEFFMPAMPPTMPAMKSAGVLKSKGKGVYKGKVKVEMGAKWNVTIYYKDGGEDKMIKFDAIAEN